ncbi:MAG: TadE family protein [Sphingomicrobium sp.]
MIARLRNLLANQDGAALIEMAMVAPVFALMVIGVVDMSNAFSRKLALEQGAQRAIEKIMQTTEDSTVEGTLKTEAICQVNGVNSDGSCKSSPITASNVTTMYTLECTGSGGAATTQQNSDPATFEAYTCGSGTTKSASYLSVIVTDQYTPLFPLHFSAFNSDGTYHLSATAGMRIE